MLTFEKVLEIFADYLAADAVSYTHLPMPTRFWKTA